MRDAEDFRKQARRCRALSKTAIQPEEIEQFRMWAVELANEAEEAERRAAKREENRRGRAAVLHPIGPASTAAPRQRR